MIRKISISMLFILSIPTFAQNNEVTGSASGVYSFTKIQDSHIHSLDLSGGYDRSLNEIFQLGAILNYFYYSTSSASSTGLSFLVGPTFNFGADSLKSSFFATLHAGLIYSKTLGRDSNKDFRASAVLGKRFAITDSVIYKPSLEYQMIRLSNYTESIFSVKFLVLSVLF